MAQPTYEFVEPTDQQRRALARRAERFGLHFATVDSANGAFGYLVQCQSETLTIPESSRYLGVSGRAAPDDIRTRAVCAACGKTFMLNLPTEHVEKWKAKSS